MTKNFIFILAITSLIASSCVSSLRNGYVINTERQTMSFRPNLVRLDLSMDNFEYLGQSELSVVSRNYLGVIQVIDSVNNEQFNPRDVKLVKLSGFADIKLKQEMKKAAYKVVDDYPDADYYVIGSDYEKTHKITGGSKTWRTVNIHAYRFKR